MPELNTVPHRTAAPRTTGFVPDVTILGAGIIGLSLALELHARGARVQVIERGAALQQASTAAAGMLAAHDPHNPPALLPLATLSLSLYPSFLARVTALSGLDVPYQTQTTMQYLANGSSVLLAEHSLDPRRLARALLAAISATSIQLREQSTLPQEQHPGQPTHAAATLPRATGHLVYASGAWTTWPHDSPAVMPRKGQMLRVALPLALQDLHTVHRSEQVYIVPRTLGPHAGTALIGASVENAGFDTTTNAPALHQLRHLAAQLLPALADPAQAPQLEAWAGLRPATADELPILGRACSDSGDDASLPYFATGHFRNGILLAPATAIVIADLIERKTPQLDMRPFSPQRFCE